MRGSCARSGAFWLVQVRSQDPIPESDCRDALQSLEHCTILFTSVVNRRRAQSWSCFLFAPELVPAELTSLLRSIGCKEVVEEGGLEVSSAGLLREPDPANRISAAEPP